MVAIIVIIIMILSINIIITNSARRRQTCDFRERASSAPAELGREIRKVSRNRARTQVRLQARKWHVCGSGACGAVFWASISLSLSLSLSIYIYIYTYTCTSL